MEPSTILCLGQARTLSDAATAWQVGGKDRHLPDLERVLRWAVELADAVHDLQRRAWRALWAGHLLDAQAAGLGLREVHHAVLRTFQLIAATVEAGQVGGRAPEGLDAFEDARKRVERLAADFREGWPLVEPEEVEAARGRIAGGQFGTLEDLTRAAVDDPH